MWRGRRWGRSDRAADPARRVGGGRTAVLDTGPLQLVVAEQRCEPFDLGVFTHCGIDPLRAKYIVLWSRQHFRAGFEPIARTVLRSAGPGVCSSDYASFPYRHLRRPLFPIDRDAPMGGRASPGD